MDLPFIYDRSVTGKNFIGRKEDCTIISNLISQKENIVIHGPAKTGKMSLVRQVLFNRRMMGENFVVAEVSLLGARTMEDFVKIFGGAVARVFATTPSEYSEIVRTYLQDSHFVFDRRRFTERDEIISLNWDLDENDVRKMLFFPYLAAFERNVRLLVIINEFQNVEFFDNSYMLYKQFESVIKEIRSRLEEPMCSFIFMGSRGNAIKEIFCHQHRFYRLVEHFTPSSVDEKDIVAYVEKGFLTGGKVLQKESILGVCRLLRNNVWYINHFVSICDHLSRGFVSESVLVDALDMLMSVHEPRFIAMMSELTTFQVNLLKAILEGNPKISGAEIIRDYHLSSSANVKRLKDALIKKEVVTVDEKDNMSIADPLFELWARKKYFQMPE